MAIITDELRTEHSQRIASHELADEFGGVLKELELELDKQDGSQKWCTKSAAHTKSSRYMSEQVKEWYHQCTNLDCSCTFKTNESITKVITAPPQPEKEPAAPPEPVRDRQTLGRYGSEFRQIH